MGIQNRFRVFFNNKKISFVSKKGWSAQIGEKKISCSVMDSPFKVIQLHMIEAH